MEVKLNLQPSETGQSVIVCGISYTEILTPSDKICNCCNIKTGDKITYDFLKIDTRFNPNWIKDDVIKKRVVRLLDKIYKNIIVCQNHACKVRIANETMASFNRKGHEVLP